MLNNVLYLTVNIKLAYGVRSWPI